MRTGAEELEAELARILKSTPWLLEVLQVVRAVGLPDWYVAAGAIRNTVWDFLHGRASCGPLGDIDVIYFGPLDPKPETESLLRRRRPQYRWEVTDQATVHRWQSVSAGHPVAPFRSIVEAVSSWPETATAVGVRLASDESMELLAPFGLADLFSMTVRPSPTRSSDNAYDQRARDKGWTLRWPRVRVVPRTGTLAV